ncbi:hypothetical protein F4803DRAFT_530665 [Xylaria telfairii]|nr:hypothetical protein F4803DRAFT_530665 [Xylaria telfairii]
MYTVCAQARQNFEPEQLSPAFEGNFLFSLCVYSVPVYWVEMRMYIYMQPNIIWLSIATGVCVSLFAHNKPPRSRLSESTHMYVCTKTQAARIVSRDKVI